MDKALQQSVRLRRLEAAASSGSSYKYSDLVAALAYSYRGKKAEAAPHLQNLEQAMGIGKVPAATVARVYSVLGDGGRAMDLLESAEHTRDRDLLYLKVSPFYRSLRGSDRYDALLRRMRM
jgi:hypothetical protein